MKILRLHLDLKIFEAWNSCFCWLCVLLKVLLV